MRDVFKTVDDLMGIPGRLVGSSKNSYAKNHEKNLVVFNGNLFIQLEDRYQKIWYGDVDVTREEPTLIELAKQLDTTVFLLREMDGRFEYEEKPKIEKSVARIYPDGMVMLEE